MANTHSLDLELGSSQFAFKTDTASLSITGDITVECWVKLESAPSDSIFTFVSKYNSNTNNVSYDFDYRDVSGTKTLRFLVSANGSTVSTLTKAQTLNTGTFYHLAATYDVSEATAEWFVSGSSIGTSTGTVTSIHDGTAQFRIGSLVSSGGANDNFYDGLIDDVRLWSDLRTPTEISTYKNYELVGNEANLNGYWKLNNGYLDETTNGNNLTSSGSPVFSTTVPHSNGLLPSGGAFLAFM